LLGVLKGTVMLRRFSFLAICGLSAVLAVEATAGDMHPVDLTKYVNEKLDGGYGRLGQGNNLAKLPRGEQKLGDATFKIGDGMMQLGSLRAANFPDRINGIKVGRTCDKIHVLHATLYGGSSRKPTETNVVVPEREQIGEYIFTYGDGSTEGFPIIHGEDVRDWWYVPGEADGPTIGKVAWEGTNEFADGKRAGIRVYSREWKNPFPSKMIKSIDFVGRKAETEAAPFCIAITLEDRDKNAPPDARSTSAPGAR
jgi:hypothetical protein